MSQIFVPKTTLIDPAAIHRPDDNPNRMSVEEYESLKKFIRTRGFLQPVEVTQTKNLTDVDSSLPYTVIDGDHRVRIAQELNMPKITAIVVDGDEADRLRDRIGMNKHRGELDVVTVARDLERLLNEFNYNADEIADTGFTNAETLELLEAVQPTSSEDVLRDAVSGPPQTEVDNEDAAPKSWRLTLRFETEKGRTRAKTALHDYSEDGSLTDGLLHILAQLDGDDIAKD